VETFGYYKSNQPIDLSSLKVRWGKLIDLLKNKGYQKLILYLNEEDYNEIAMLDLFLAE
jgi:hypothetical protein